MRKFENKIHPFFMTVGLSCRRREQSICAGESLVEKSDKIILQYNFDVVSFTLLVKILQNLPLGLVYGIWGGIGSAVTMLVGVVVWHDPFTAFTAVGVVLVIGGVYLLNKGTDEIEAAREQQR